MAIGIPAITEVVYGVREGESRRTNSHFFQMS
jgi:hypothetical protein